MASTPAFAWRNIRRNPRRTLLTLLVICVGTASLILTDAFVLGTQENVIELSTGIFAGQAQIHHPKFKELDEPQYTLHKLPLLRKTLSDSPRVKAFTERVLITGMIASSRDAAMVQVYGVDFSQEIKVSQLKKSLIFGNYPGPHDDRPIVLGYKLAKQLQVEEGDKVVITTAEAPSGELVQELFRVVGRTNFHSRPLDSGVAFIPIDLAQNFLKLPQGVHEIALDFETIGDAINYSLPIWKELEQLGALAEGWDRVFPALKAMMDMNQYSIFIVGAILFALISLSILNTMFMSIYERMFEFGVMRAIGTRSRQLGVMIITECLGIGVLGVLLGTLLGGSLALWLRQRGISYAEFEMNGMSMVEPIRAILRMEQFTVIPLAVLFMCGLASLYPALHASRLTPSDAMKQSQ